MSKLTSITLCLFTLVLFTATSVLSYSETNSAKKAEVIVKPSDVIEKCLKVQPSEQLHYSFTSSKPLMFNLHYHLLDNTVFHVKEEVAKREEIFTPVKGQKVYCMEWRNPLAEDVNLNYEYALD